MVQFEAFKLKLDISTVCEVPMLTLGLSLAVFCPSLFKCWYRKEAHLNYFLMQKLLSEE